VAWKQCEGQLHLQRQAGMTATGCMLSRRLPTDRLPGVRQPPHHFVILAAHYQPRMQGEMA